MPKTILQKPIKAIVAGNVPIISKQVGKYFDEFVAVGRELKVNRKQLADAQVMVFVMQACDVDLRHTWTDYAKTHGLHILACRKGSDIPPLLEKDFEIREEEPEGGDEPTAIPESMLKAQQAQEEAQQIAERAVASTKPTGNSGIESLDLIANIQKEVQTKISKAQQEVDEAMALYLKESEKVKELNALLTTAQEEKEDAEEKINAEIKLRLEKAVEKETVKLRTDLRRKEKELQDSKKVADKHEEETARTVKRIAELQKEVDTVKANIDNENERGFDINTVVMVHHLLMIAHVVQYLDRDNQWIVPLWKLLKGMSKDTQVANIIEKISEVSMARQDDGKAILIPPLADAERNLLKSVVRSHGR